MSIASLSSMQLRHAAEIKDKIVDLQHELKQLLGETTATAPVMKKRRKMSASARKKIGAAQKARWAKAKADKK